MYLSDGRQRGQKRDRCIMLDVADTSTDNRTKDMDRVFLQELRRKRRALEEEARAQYNKENDNDIDVAPLEEVPDDLEEITYPTGREHDWSLLESDMQAEYGGYLNAITRAELEVEAEERESRRRKLGNLQDDLTAFQAAQKNLIDELYKDELGTFKDELGTFKGSGKYFRFKLPNKDQRRRLRNLIEGLTGYNPKPEMIYGGGNSSMSPVRPRRY